MYVPRRDRRGGWLFVTVAGYFMFIISGSLLLLAGCVVRVPAHVQAQRSQFVSTVPTCATDRECELKWAAARNWVLANSETKFQHLTSDFMETYNALNTASPSFRVVKQPLPTSGYQILVTVGCRNPFGCIPDPWALALWFNQHVNAVGAQVSPPAAPPPPPGPRPIPDWCKGDNVQWLGDRCVEKK
jgi:hypothetical protein